MGVSSDEEEGDEQEQEPQHTDRIAPENQAKYQSIFMPPPTAAKTNIPPTDESNEKAEGGDEDAGAVADTADSNCDGKAEKAQAERTQGGNSDTNGLSSASVDEMVEPFDMTAL